MVDFKIPNEKCYADFSVNKQRIHGENRVNEVMKNRRTEIVDTYLAEQLKYQSRNLSYHASSGYFPEKQRYDESSQKATMKM